jgi:hypothetical protein
MLEPSNRFQLCNISCCLLHADFLLALFVNPTDGGDMFLQNSG